MKCDSHGLNPGVLAMKTVCEHLAVLHSTCTSQWAGALEEQGPELETRAQASMHRTQSILVDMYNGIIFSCRKEWARDMWYK
jgi:hypothetical protein